MDDDADVEPEEEAPAPADDLEPLLEFLRDRRGFDFTGYKRPSLTRRIRKRMRLVDVDTYAGYLALLESQPAEFAELFDSILINVTSFMRDREAWERIRDDVIPAIVDRSDRTGGEIRIWSAGCATGQEAYTLAVLLADAVGEERFRMGVKIYATDADEDALREARLARYSYRALVEAFGEDQTGRYFEPHDNAYTFRTDLRRSVIFGRHDLVQDPPISRIDLISCRNTLMYFNAEIQARILSSFHFALVEGGFLFLGKAEAFATRTNLFASVDLKQHIFAKQSPRAVPRPPLPPASGRVPLGRAAHIVPPLVEAAFEGGPTAQLAVDADGALVAANRLARTLFGLGTNQIGRALRDLEVSYRPVELRSIIDQVMAGRRPVTVPEVTHRSGLGRPDTFDVVVHPVEEGAAVKGVTVTFVDVTRYKVLQEALEKSHRELEVAHEELQSAVEELETTNEELQSTNEELETTNEELHSTNEELETINEELQSTNEELEAVNEELRLRTEETNEANRFLQSILRGIHAGVAVLAPDLTVRAWNAQAEDLWGLRADEVQGEHFLNLDIGLPVERLRHPIRAVLSSEDTLERVALEAVNRRGRRIDAMVTISLLRGEREPAGVILLMEEVQSGDGGA